MDQANRSFALSWVCICMVVSPVGAGCSPDGEAVAIKAVAKQPQGTSHAEAVQRLSTIANEVDILARLTGSLNVIHLYSACENAHTVYVVMELCRGGEIWHTYIHPISL